MLALLHERQIEFLEAITPGTNLTSKLFSAGHVRLPTTLGWSDRDAGFSQYRQTLMRGDLQQRLYANVDRRATLGPSSVAALVALR